MPDFLNRHWKRSNKVVTRKRQLRKCLQLRSPCRQEEWSPIEIQFCNIVAWTGAIVITVVILRSLYLLYMKPEGTWTGICEVGASTIIDRLCGWSSKDLMTPLQSIILKKRPLLFIHHFFLHNPLHSYHR